MPRKMHPNSLANLKHGNKATQFESGSRRAVECGRKGAEVTNAKYRTQEQEAEEWQRLLNLPLNDAELGELRSFMSVKGENMVVSMAMKAKIISLALKGERWAFELVMRYALLGHEETATPEAEESSFIKALNGAAEVWNDDEKK